MRYHAVPILVCCWLSATADEIDKDRPTTDPISEAALHPWKGDFRTPEQVGLPADTVYFNNATGQRLRGWLFSAPGAEQTILFCMGNAGNISLMLPYAKILQDAGFEVLLFDYQGFGESEGIANVGSLVGDCEAAFRFLVDSRQRQPKQIGLFGVSLGSVVALTIAAEQNAGPVAVEDVFIPHEQIDKLASRYINKDDPVARFALASFKAVFLGRVNPLANVERIKSPVFFLHGVNDWLLPPAGTLKVATACTAPNRVWMMDDTGHAPESLEVNDREYAAQLQRFFSDAFTTKLDNATATIRSSSVRARRRYVQVEVDCPERELPMALEIALLNDRGRAVFHRGFFSGRQTVSVLAPFQVTQAFATEFQHTVQNTAGWQPELSDFSESLKSYRMLAHSILGGERKAEYFSAFEGRYFYSKQYLLGRFPSFGKNGITEILPDPDSVPNRICTRYAGLMARLSQWKRARPGERSHAEQIRFAELMTTYLPEDFGSYYEIGNARFQLGLKDAVIAKALYLLAKERLRQEKPREAQALLVQYLHALPGDMPTQLTPEKIAAIESVADLPE